ncbi:MAG: ATP-binding protein [Deltaproteobacteria bacterium]|nr:ATP-binding protein [Deltaproteobacteria bacterium]
MKSYENYALLLGENLSHQVFQNFVLPVTSRYGQIRLREKRQYDMMDRIVKSTIHSFNIDLVNIYEIGTGVIAYSTDPELIGKRVKKSLGYKRAVEGEDSSRLVSGGDDLWGLGIEALGGEKKFRTFIPFRGVDPFTGQKGEIGGVFELIQDLSEEYASIVRLQYLIFGLSILIMGLIFVALLLIVQKAERILDQRAEAQRQLEAQLNQTERLAALGKMVAGVSHEIRNPLGIIRSTAELLRGMPKADETQSRLSELIIEESSRLNNIVTEFLDFARPQKPNVQDCHLDEILKKGLQFIGPEAESKGISLEDNLDHRSLHIKADPHLLYRSFLNICVNALQSMEGGGKLIVNVTEEKDTYIIRFEDTGTGIAPDDRGRIFDPFFSTKDKGSGLGLSIVKNIIEGHGGHINIESREKGDKDEDSQRTTVIIKLPRSS